jgi:hypothetical protein
VGGQLSVQGEGETRGNILAIRIKGGTGMAEAEWGENEEPEDSDEEYW